MTLKINIIKFYQESILDNKDLYEIWYIVMRAIEYGVLKDKVTHLDQVLEEKIAHHHIKYKGHKFYISIVKRT